MTSFTVDELDAAGQPVALASFDEWMRRAIEREGAEPTTMQKWHSDTDDVREEPEILAELFDHSR